MIYELHVGTFTREGTYAAAAEQLPELARARDHRRRADAASPSSPAASAGATTAWTCSRRRRLYGTPDDLRRFVDRAHALGLGVILDVVYNHLGPTATTSRAFAREYFSDRYENEWGEALNFDGPGAGPVREFFVENAGYWIEEFHLDGLRLDATQHIFDASSRHVIAEVAERVRRAAARSARPRSSSPRTSRRTRGIVRPPEQGGYGCDALWNDDFHHSARVALTGRHEAYYPDYRGTPQELVSALKWGYLFQGQRYHWQYRRRGQPALDLAARSSSSPAEPRPGGELAARPRAHELTSPGAAARARRRCCCSRRRRRCSSRARSSRPRPRFSISPTTSPSSPRS